MKHLDAWLDRVGSSRVLELLADAVPEAAVFAVDRDRRLVLWSAGAESLLGFRASEVLGEHCLKANRCRQCMVGCGIAEHGRVSDVPLTLYRADGSAVRVRKSGRALFDDDGVFVGGVEVLMAEGEAAGHELDGGGIELHGLVTRDPRMIQVFQTVRNVAETTATVLVQGESGTGKELVARAIHLESTRHAGPFVAVSCAALTPSLTESELFGHVRGAFTGAVSDRQGIFQQASGGTLFLDEIAELPLELQAKLLRALEERVVVPVGGERPIEIDVRVVAATHRSLEHEVAAGRFREDLMYRLRVVPIVLPPLRERRGDVELLVHRFVAQRNAVGPRYVASVEPDAMRVLLRHTWPGNVRELKNALEYAFAVGRKREIAVSELPPELHAAPSAPLADDEADRIRQALAQTGGQAAKAAKLLGMSRATFWRKRKLHGIA